MNTYVVMPESKSLVGMTFGRLTVLDHFPNGKVLCLCDCACFHLTSKYSLLSHAAKSCGCFYRERMASGIGTTHGMSNRQEYRSWEAMIRRCSSPIARGYHNYGGRGIKVCSRWVNSFSHFFEDMGPSGGLSIDRIDTNGHYSCGKCEECKSMSWGANCKWSTPDEQVNNRRNNRIIEINGEFKTMAQWYKPLGISQAAFLKRMAKRPKTDWLLTKGTKR